MDETPDDEQIRKLVELNKNFDLWEEKLKREEEDIINLESQIEIKESVYQSIENNLKIIEDRQARFEQLLSLYENQYGNTNSELPRSEVLDKAKSLSRSLEDHQTEIENMNENVTTLRDMIYLISDVHCKFSKLKNKIAPNQAFGDEEFEDQEEEE